MITTKWFSGVDDLTDAHKIRKEVFIKEQGVPYDIEIDGTDSYAISLVLYYDSNPIATGRIIMIEDNYTLGRICVLKEYRNKKVGVQLVDALCDKAYSIGAESIHIHAQSAVLDFYKKLGFIPYGDEYKEAGIIHKSMQKKLN